MSESTRKYDAMVYKVEGASLPVIKIQFTLYHMKRKGLVWKLRASERSTTIIECSKVQDAGEVWNGVNKPRGGMGAGWTLLAMFKVPGNDVRSAMWAVRKWLGE